ncbi:hypothetical protein QUB70_07365 [Microcoleus sp. A003_D6]
MPVPQPLNLIVGWASRPRPKQTGKMPVPQPLNLIVGCLARGPNKQARCLFHNHSI